MSARIDHKGDSDHGGFTTALPTNTKAISPQGLDLYLASINEEDGGPTYAAGATTRTA